MNAFQINKITVFVTGSESVLGIEICVAFAKAGANVLAAHFNKHALNTLTKATRSHGCDVVAFCLDVNDHQAFFELDLRLKYK
jgi:NAD(P)-dependent dehydrogenase (short-subunit alcohol dehydrogenase family)